MAPLTRFFRYAAALALCAALACAAWPVDMLEVRESHGKTVFRAALAGVNSVGVGFTHSLYRVPQEEKYLLQDGRLKLASVFFGSFDALDYYDPLEVYPRRQVPEGFQVRISPPAELPVSFAMGQQTAMWLRLGESKVIDLNRLMPRGNGFTLTVTRWPRLSGALMEFTHGGR